MVDRDARSHVSRRRFLQQAGLTVSAAAVLSGLDVLDANGSVASAAPNDDPDKLFKDGRFKEAERGYRRRLRKDPNDAHAAAQVGYIALLSNRFGDAEQYLTRAVRLAPDDFFSVRQLADCYVRQDRFSHAVPLFRGTGDERDVAMAELYDAISGTPWQVHGPNEARIPLGGLEPLPHLEVSINGTAPRTFLFDTGATVAGCSMEMAREAGLQTISTTTDNLGGNNVTVHHGIAESVRIGDMEVRNAPVQWHDLDMPSLPDGTKPHGVFGTTYIHHFLATVDYANRQFVLRRKTEANLRRLRTTKAEVLPLWLTDHIPLTMGTVNDYGPRLVTFDTGGVGRGIDISFANAERAGAEVDWDHPIGDGLYPIVPERISLGRATRRKVQGLAQETIHGPVKFDTIANFTQYYFWPFAITLDFTHMHLYVTGKSLDPDTH